jgi:hypothetical protein
VTISLATIEYASRDRFGFRAPLFGRNPSGGKRDPRPMIDILKTTRLHYAGDHDRLH